MSEKQYKRFMFIPIVLIVVFSAVIIRNFASGGIQSFRGSAPDEETAVRQGNMSSLRTEMEEELPPKGENRLVNINTASKEELMTLPEIGEKRAEDIIRYRNEAGEFKRIEDLKNVKGIGDSTVENLKGKIEL